MINQKTKMLSTTLRKFYSRKAESNIKRILKKTHSAEIAVVLEEFSFEEVLEIFKMEEKIDKRAEILSHFPLDVQLKILEALPQSEGMALIQSMDSDDAADILGSLPEPQSKKLLSSMKKDSFKNVSDLLGYPEDSAGGLMDANVFSLNQNLSIQAAIDSIEVNKEKQNVYYIYVVNESGHLIGIVSLKQLLLSQKTETLKDIMNSNILSVTLDTKQEDVARIVERYDLLALPVIDSNNKLMGVITVDDVLDVIREEAEGEILAMGSGGSEVNPSVFVSFKNRLPWGILSFASGFVCFMILLLFYFLQRKEEMSSNEDWWKALSFLPVFFNLGGVLGSQASAVSLSGIRGGYFNAKNVLSHLRKEFILSVIFSLIFGGSVYLIGGLFFSYSLKTLLSLTLSLQVIFSVLLGSLIPLLFYKWGLKNRAVSLPLVYTSLVNVFTTLVFFGFLYGFI